MTDLIRLRTEPCSVCNKTLALGVISDQLKPNVTGLDLFLDLHGIEDEQKHARLLYIDANGFVRTITVITKFSDVLH
ncbi:MAG: hypothetical protein ACXACU_04415 [Candidatus Hodarchaeales archaeon]|jgi:hypothetical protein